MIHLIFVLLFMYLIAIMAIFFMLCWLLLCLTQFDRTRYVIKVIFFVSLTLYISTVLYVSIYELTRKRHCVALPNGLIIDHPSLVDFLLTPFSSIRALKLPDGTNLVRDYVDRFYFTKTSVYGLVSRDRYFLIKSMIFKESKTIKYTFHYRKDTGFFKHEGDEFDGVFVYDSGDPIIITENGTLLPYDGDDLNEMYGLLIVDPDYRKSPCPLNIFPY